MERKKVIKKQRRSKIREAVEKEILCSQIKAGFEIQGAMIFHRPFMQKKKLYGFFIDIKSKNRNSKRRLTVRTCT
jgi:predicted Ser/Thr protein kinase